MAFCPACGKEAVDTFCEACLRDQNPLIGDVKKMVLNKCSTCDRIRVGGQWLGMRSFPRFVKKHVVFAKNAQIDDVSFPEPVFEGRVREFVLPLEVRGTISSQIEPYLEEYEIPVSVQLDACDRCKLAGSSYFEGILQIRNPRDEVIEFIEKRVAEEDPNLITKARDVRGGVDFDFTDQKFLLQFVHDLRRRFGGEVKVVAKLHTYDATTSKKVYRLTALLRLTKFWIGDIIETEKKLMRITNLGVTISGVDLRLNKKTGMPCPTDNEVEILEPVKVVVSASKPTPMILDPDDYQEVPLSGRTPVVAGDEIVVVQDSRGKWFVADAQPKLS